MDLRPSALFVPDLKQMLADKSYRELRGALATLNPVDLAEGWKDFPPLERVVLFKLLSSVRALEVFEELDVLDQVFLLETLEPGSLGPVVEGMDPADVRALFHPLPDRAVKRMLALVRRDRRGPGTAAAEFPPGTAGSLMHTEVLDLRPAYTAQQALETVRAASRLHRMHDLMVLYVTDAQGRLLGSLSPRALIAAPRDMRLAEIMSPVQLVKIRADLDLEEAAKVFQRFKLIAAPVVDAESRLVGVLSGSDILNVVSQEATEDIAKMAGTQAEELETASPLRIARLRMPWLFTTCIAEVVVGGVVHFFEATVTQAVALASFMPLIAAMGGNVGTQSSTLCVRGLATGHIQPKDWFRITRREFLSGLYMGTGYGTGVAIFSAIMLGNRVGHAFPFVVGIGVLFSMTVASTMGAFEPFILHRIKMDPAVAVGPLVTTLTDLMSVTTYLSLATAALALGWL